MTCPDDLLDFGPLIEVVPIAKSMTSYPYSYLIVLKFLRKKNLC